MNIKKIKELVDLMNENEIAEVEVEQEGMKVRIIKKNQAVADQGMMSSMFERRLPAVAEPRVPEVPEKKTGKEIKAPMVGTFYRSPSPDSAPYVEVGDVVKKGDIICIVEAMKLMNEIKTEFGGRIIEIAVENAEPVEFGQTLYVIEPV
ncbi:MAG: acetyl-CoA carboxylase biotin carboxyl carrier protein [Candidatus Omnitrophota bacterium]